MSKDTELKRLEQFVEKILGKYAELKAVKEQLDVDLADRDARIADLQGNIDVKDTERVEISVRVNKLVDQIEEWELTLDEEEMDGDDSSDEEKEEDEDPEEGEEGRVQHNLFSMSE
jgi:chromosome segregation ATPase